MDLLSAQVLQGFGITAKKIRKEKSSFLITSDIGNFTVKKSLDSCAKITFAHDIKEHLAAKGFADTDRFRVSSGGKPYVEHDGNLYVCTATTALRETNFTDPADVTRAVKAAARMHLLARGVVSDTRFRPEDALALLRRDITDTAAVKRKLGNGGLSDFDVIFLKNYDFYLAQMRFTLAELESTSFETYVAQAYSQLHIIHNRLKDETLLTDGDNLHIVNFGAAQIGYSIFDLVSLISRYIRDNPRGCDISVYALLEAYNSVSPLRIEDVRITRALLHFPFRFVKTLRAYYSKKRTWTPSAILSKIQSIAADRESYYRQLE